MTAEQMQARLAQLQAEVRTTRPVPVQRWAHKEGGRRIRQNARNAARLKTLRSGVNMVPPADAKKINMTYEYNVKMWRMRKRKAREPPPPPPRDAASVSRPMRSVRSARRSST
jgi:hypothetical protein